MKIDCCLKYGKLRIIQFLFFPLMNVNRWLGLIFSLKRINLDRGSALRLGIDSDLEGFYWQATDFKPDQIQAEWYSLLWTFLVKFQKFLFGTRK